MSIKHGCGALILTHHCSNIGMYSWMNQMPPRGILLLQRGWGAPTFPGCWGGPGGLKDPNESAAEAARREAHEELPGLRFMPDPDPFYEGEWGPPGKNTDRILSYFAGDWHGPETLSVQTDEMCGFGFFSLDQAHCLDLSFRYREAIRKLIDAE